jgi:outer membrane protein assembly factor BamB
MKATKVSILVAVTALVYTGGCKLACGDQISNSAAAMIDRYISFDDIARPGVALEQCWNAMGIDEAERVYIGFTSRRSDGREDFALFRYDPVTAERLFLGTFIDASQATGNLLPNEEIPKGHTHMLEIGGKMYMASQGFHDFKAAIDTLPEYRGAHLYAYDLARGKLEDLSASLPGGVVIEHHGIVALSYMPGYEFLVGLAHPSSDIILFDYNHNKVREIVPGIPWRLGNPLSRELVVTNKGKIYTYRGTEDPAQRGEVNNIWAFDLKTFAMIRTVNTATGGFWDGQTSTRDGQTIYVSTVNGELYKLDVEKDVFTHLGHFLPEKDYEAGVRVEYLYGITLSAEEKRIFGIPRTSRSAESNLYSYEIATGEVTLVEKLETAIYTGSDMHDSHGNIYFARFGDEEAWSGKVRLAILHPS